MFFVHNSKQTTNDGFQYFAHAASGQDFNRNIVTKTEYSVVNESELQRLMFQRLETE